MSDEKIDLFLKEINSLRENIDTKFGILDKICEIMENLKDILEKGEETEKDIAYIKSILAAFQDSPRALSRSEAAVQNTQVLIRKVDLLLKKRDENPEIDRRMTVLEMKMDIVLDLCEEVIDKKLESKCKPL